MSMRGAEGYFGEAGDASKLDELLQKKYTGKDATPMFQTLGEQQAYEELAGRLRARMLAEEAGRQSFDRDAAKSDFNLVFIEELKKLKQERGGAGFPGGQPDDKSFQEAERRARARLSQKK